MTYLITPPPELVQQWLGLPLAKAISAAFQAGADQELEACCEWLSELPQSGEWFANELRAARRPKPPSLKEQALALIDECTDPEGDYLDDSALSTIRRALETLPE
ncbi:MAG: hypothetical protein EBT15_06180 [Betaproteobacteria bacterium]|nr:hypothetical protein [Betaproteobacteria bacterium]